MKGSLLLIRGDSLKAREERKERRSRAQITRKDNAGGESSTVNPTQKGEQGLDLGKRFQDRESAPLKEERGVETLFLLHGETEDREQMLRERVYRKTAGLPGGIGRAMQENLTVIRQFRFGLLLNPSRTKRSGRQ